MNLARVTRESVRHAPAVAHAVATGGDAESFALLLGAEGDADAPALPASLLAAPAEGDVATEALAVTDGGIDEEAPNTENDTGVSLDAALAAALGLTVPIAPEAVTKEETGDGEPVADSQAVAVSISAGAATTAKAGSGGEVPTLSATPTDPTTPSEPSIDPSASTSTKAGAIAVDAAAATLRPTLDATERGTAAGADAALPSPITATAVTNGGAVVRAATVVANTEVGSGRPTPQGGHDGTNAAAQHSQTGIADAGSVAGSTAFSSGGGEQASFSDGTPDRQAFALVGKAATAPTTTTAAGYEGEKIHATSASTSGAADATPAPPPAVTSSAPTSETVTRAQHVVQHPTTIEGRWGDRVADALRLSSVRGGGEIRLQLDPEGLGHIDVRLHLQPDGVRAVIVAEHESTRALISSQQQVLQDAFSRSDLRLSGFSVDVGTGGGAASMGRDADAGQGGSAPAAPAPPVVTPSATEGLECATPPTANGRVNVRV